MQVAQQKIRSRVRESIDRANPHGTMSSISVIGNSSISISISSSNGGGGGAGGGGGGSSSSSVSTSGNSSTSGSGAGNGTSSGISLSNATELGENGFVTSYPLAWSLINGLEMYYLPALVVLGSLGNCLSVYVVFASKMRRTSSSFYLAALALSDTGFLMSVLVSWLTLVNVHIMNQQGFCQFFVYLTNVCSFLSAWFVVAFTVERFVAVCYPLRRQWMCTVYRAKTLICGVTLAGLVICSPALLYSRSRLLENTAKPVCYIAEGWDKVASGFNFLDTILTFALPFSLIVVLNSLIVKAVWHIDNVRTSLKARATARDSPPAVQQARVTKMLLVVSSVFFCLNLPAYVMRVYAYLQADGATTELEFLTQKACNLLFNTNFGISFGLYCASGQNFRSAVAQLFHCQRQPRLRPGTSKRSSANQINHHGTDTIRISGSTSGDHTIVFEKPWRDSFQLRSYPRSLHQRAVNDCESTTEDCYTPRKDYSERM